MIGALILATIGLVILYNTINFFILWRQAIKSGKKKRKKQTNK